MLQDIRRVPSSLCRAEKASKKELVPIIPIFRVITDLQVLQILHPRKGSTETEQVAVGTQESGLLFQYEQERVEFLHPLALGAQVIRVNLVCRFIFP